MIKHLSTRLALGAAVIAASLGTVGVAHASNVAWSIGLSVPGVVVGASAPSYYAPPPVYYNPAPVYYAPPPVYYTPRPVYYAPPPVYYAPRPIYYGPRGHWGGGPHWQGGPRRDWR
ncbi:hypothetical protein [Xylophilus sp. ASV27]|uniref:hypothetical protein n=1 Tax=Xylophilus sp. ASV27 TaxID=2795129 RepID=UPI0018ECB2E7|nr:hypothetical protein [Xylophilus sp. ASV27]